MANDRLKNRRSGGNNDAKRLETAIKTNYMNKYYNLFMNLFKITKGYDKEQAHYFKKKLWNDGTVATFNVKAGTVDVKSLCIAPYAASSWNTYDFAETVSLINERGVPFIPLTTQVVNKDVVLCFIQSNHKSIKETVQYYVDRMAQVDMIINTNLELQKTPYIIKCSPEDYEKFKDIMDRVLNNEIVIHTDVEAQDVASVLATQAPFIVSQLHAYKITLENELLSALGIDNAGNSAKATTETLDEVNANNVLINIGLKQFKDNLQEFADSVKEVLGQDIIFEFNADEAEESAESRNRSNAYNGKENTKGEQEQEEGGANND